MESGGKKRVVVHLLARMDDDDLAMLAEVGEAAPGLVVEVCQLCRPDQRSIDGFSWHSEGEIDKCAHHLDIERGTSAGWWLVGSRVAELSAKGDDNA